MPFRNKRHTVYTRLSGQLNCCKRKKREYKEERSCMTKTLVAVDEKKKVTESTVNRIQTREVTYVRYHGQEKVKTRRML